MPCGRPPLVTKGLFRSSRRMDGVHRRARSSVDRSAAKERVAPLVVMTPAERGGVTIEIPPQRASSLADSPAS